MKLSRRLAYFFGVATPLAETLRRWGSWWDNPPAYLDDFLLGALLIAGAWATRDPRSGRGKALLAAAWGFAAGMAYDSTASQWFAMRAGQADPSGLPSGCVLAIKLVGGLVFVAALAMTVTADDADLPGEGTETSWSGRRRIRHSDLPRRKDS